jgi:hypothetical protein
MSGLKPLEALMPLHPAPLKIRSVSIAKPARFRLNLTGSV